MPRALPYSTQKWPVKKKRRFHKKGEQNFDKNELWCIINVHFHKPGWKDVQFYQSHPQAITDRGPEPKEMEEKESKMAAKTQEEKINKSREKYCFKT